MRIFVAAAFAAFFLFIGSAGAQVSQYDAITKGVAGFPDVAASPAAVAVSGSSARTASDVPLRSVVRILCDADAFVALGSSAVTATTSDKLTVVASYPEVFNVGDNPRIAFITSGATGTCRVVVLR